MLGLILFFVGIAYYFIGGSILAETEANPVLFVAGYIVIAIVIIYFYRKASTKCPNCGKSFAMKEISRELVDKKATTMQRKMENYDKKGNVTGYRMENVPATTYYYDCVDECKYCQYRRKVMRCDTTRDYSGTSYL